jgi:uncharacterized membrane protein
MGIGVIMKIIHFRFLRQCVLSLSARLAFVSFPGQTVEQGRLRRNRMQHAVVHQRTRYLASLLMSISMAALPCSAAMAQNQYSELFICNKSQNKSINVAKVEFNPMRSLVGAYSWFGDGWANIAPGRCKSVMTHLTNVSSYYLRIMYGNSVIIGHTDGDILTAVNEKFCTNNSSSYSWNRVTEAQARNDCDYKMAPGLFTFLLRFQKPTQYTLHIDPELVGRGPVEKFGLTRSETDVIQAISELISLDIAGYARQQLFREAVQRANGKKPRPKLLTCTYFNKEFTFWHSNIPENLHEFIKIDGTNGNLSWIGTDPQEKCPKDEAEASRVEAKNKESWRKAYSEISR